MAFTTKSIFIGCHLWLAPLGDAFTSPAPGVIAQLGAANWPDSDETKWADWALGIVASFDVDPKYGPREEILAPSPGAVQAMDVLIPYAIPEIKFSLLQVSSLAPQLALNTERLFATANTVATPNGGAAPGIRGILKAQKYDQNNNLIWNWQSWAFVQLDGSLKGDPKSMTKPGFMGTLLYSDNNDGAVDNAIV